MKKTLVILVAALVLAGFLFKLKFTNNGGTTTSDYKNATYNIEGQAVKLTDGKSETPSAPSSTSKIVTKYFGNEVRYDFDGDGREDVAFLLTQETGGSGTFFYVVAALNTPSGFVGSKAMFLGDRIAPQTTEMDGNKVIVNYADRNPGESFAVSPSLGKSIWLLFDPKLMQFGEVVQNFEGEADPSKMTLGMKTWLWINTLYNDGKEFKPNSPGKFSLTFKNDKTFSVTTDCNSVGGDYSVSDSKISFSKMFSTMMYCGGSQESDFKKMLEAVQSYHFTSKGELVFDLKFDSGTFIFR